MQHDILADVLSALKNAELKGISEIKINPVSKLVLRVLEVLKANKYIVDFTYVKTIRGGEVTITSAKRINKIGVIKPRFPTKLTTYEKYERRYLPARNFGVLIVSTSQGLMTHTDAIQKSLGGSLIAYVY